MPLSIGQVSTEMADWSSNVSFFFFSCGSVENKFVLSWLDLRFDDDDAIFTCFSEVFYSHENRSENPEYNQRFVPRNFIILHYMLLNINFYKKCIFNSILIRSMSEHLVKTIIRNLIFNYLYMCAHMQVKPAWFNPKLNRMINNKQPVRKKERRGKEMRNFCITLFDSI